LEHALWELVLNKHGGREGLENTKPKQRGLERKTI
jgi:hypothetical protein